MASPTVVPLRFSREILTGGQAAFFTIIKYKQVSKSLPNTRNKELSSSIAHVDSNVSTVLDLDLSNQPGALDRDNYTDEAHNLILFLRTHDFLSTG